MGSGRMMRAMKQQERIHGDEEGRKEGEEIRMDGA